MRTRYTTIALAAFVVMAATGALAQGAATPGTGSSITGGGASPHVQPGSGTRNDPAESTQELSRRDRKFVEDAAASGMFEVQVSQLAAVRATNPEIKSYASMLVDHHSAANNELVALANAKRVTLSVAPPRAMRKTIESIGKKKGADFDREYLQEAGIRQHERDIKLFEKANADVKDPQLKQFVVKTLPVLREHLAAATSLSKGGSFTASRSGSTGSGAPAITPGAGAPGGVGPAGTRSGGLSPAGRGS